MQSIIYKWRGPVFLALAFVFSAEAADPTRAISRTCAAELVQRAKAEGLLNTLKTAHERNFRLYRRYMEKGGLMRSRAFEWAAAEAGAQNLELGKDIVQFFDWKVAKNPDRLADEVWRQLAAHYDLSFISEEEVSIDEANRDSAELNARLAQTGETQEEFFIKAREIAEIAESPESLVEFKKYISENLPEYGKAAVRYEVARRMRQESWENLTSPLTLGLGVGLPAAGGFAASYMADNAGLGIAAGVGLFGGWEIWTWSKAFRIQLDAKRRDKRVTKQLKDNLANLDVKSLAEQHGLELDVYRALLENAGAKIYQPYKSVVDQAPALEIFKVEFTPEALQKTLAEAADYYSAYGSTLSALSLPLRAEILRRTADIMDARHLGRLDKSIALILTRAAQGQTVSLADVQGMVAGPVQLRIHDLLQQAKDMTAMEQDLRKLRDASRAAHATLKAEASRLYQGLDALEKNGAQAMQDRFEDFGRIDGEIQALDDTAVSLEGATIAIGAARLLIENLLQMMQTTANTIQINSGGQDGLVGENVIADLQRVADIIEKCKNYSSDNLPSLTNDQSASPAAVKSTPAGQTVPAPEAAPKKAEAKPRPAI